MRQLWPKTRNLNWHVLLPVVVAAVAFSHGMVSAQETADVIPPGRDLFGDPLPHGAVARLGTVRSDVELPDGYAPMPSLRGMAFSPDGKLLATYGNPADPTGRREILVWDAATGRQKQVLRFEGPEVRDIAFSADGRKLVSAAVESAGANGETRIWDVETGRTLHAIPNGASKVQFLHESQHVAVAHKLHVHVYNVEDAELVEKFPSQTYVQFLSSNAERMLASIYDRDLHVRLFEVAHGRELLKLDIPDARRKPRTAVLSPDQRTIAASNDNEVLVWEVLTGRPLYKLSGHTKSVTSLDVSPDGRWLASGSADGTVRLWELATGVDVQTLEGHLRDGKSTYVMAVTFSRAGHRLASGGTDATALVWDVDELARSTLPTGELNEAALESLWPALAGEQPKDAYWVVGRLADEPESALAYLKSKIEPVLLSSEQDRIQALIAQLDDPEYHVRDSATAALIKLRQIAKPLLLRALDGDPSAETRFRLRAILNQPGDAERFTKAERVRFHRVLQALEQMNDPHALEFVENIALRFPDEEILRDAAATLERMRRRNHDAR